MVGNEFWTCSLKVHMYPEVNLGGEPCLDLRFNQVL